MNEERLDTIEKIERFLAGSASIEFSASGDDCERYGHISRVLKRFDYPRRDKRERGVLLRYLQHTSGYSRAQVTRLVTRWQRNRLAKIPLAKRYGGPAVPFARKYTLADIALLVEMDKANEDVCGPAIAHLLQRAYHITCVDAVSQWQVEACVQGISEAFLQPVLALVIDQFPFVILGFHSDNGSEYINRQVADMLEKLRIEQTKSRSRHSNDNALAESKNASVVRKHMGYSHIPQQFAQPINLSIMSAD